MIGQEIMSLPWAPAPPAPTPQRQESNEARPGSQTINDS